MNHRPHQRRRGAVDDRRNHQTPEERQPQQQQHEGKSSQKSSTAARNLVRYYGSSSVGIAAILVTIIVTILLFDDMRGAFLWWWNWFRLTVINWSTQQPLPRGPTAVLSNPQLSTAPTTQENNEQSHRQQEQYHHDSSSSTKLYYVGQFGLGHRFSKLSAAYHLAKYVWNMSILEVHWGNCKVPHGMDLMSLLFDTHLFDLHHNHDDAPRSSHKNQTTTTTTSRAYSPTGTGILLRTAPAIVTDNHNNNKVILVRNDVEGYYAGQNYKNAQRPVPASFLCPPAVLHTDPRIDNYHRKPNQGSMGPHHHLPHLRDHPWATKLRSDYEFFQLLLHRFETKFAQVQKFQQQVNWRHEGQGNHNNHPKGGRSSHQQQQLVIGVHIRAGNGEKDHFEQAQRGSSVFTSTTNHTTTTTVPAFVSNLCKLIKVWIRTQYKADPRPSILLFLATDTAKLIPMVQEACGNSNVTDASPAVRIVVWPQRRVPDQHGVSYAAWTSEQECYQGWVDSMTDMTLLSKVDVLIAAQRSTFTQIVPRSLLLDQSYAHSRQEEPSSSSPPQPSDHANTTKYFCEVGSGAECMTCHTNSWSWLFRDALQQRDMRHCSTTRNEGNPSPLLLSSTPSNSSQHSFASGITVCGDERSNPRPVVHKAMLHLPDWETSPALENAKQYLQQTTLDDALAGASFRRTTNQKDHKAKWFVLGERINTKYRGDAGGRIFREEWTLDR